MLRSILKLSLLTLATHAVTARADFSAAEIEQIEREAREREAQLEKAHHRIANASSPDERLKTIVSTLQQFPTEDVATQAVGHLEIWSRQDPGFLKRAAGDVNFMRALNAYLGGVGETGSLPFAARQLCVIYGDLIQANPQNPEALNLVESLFANPETRDRGTIILISAWDPLTTDLSLYLNSPKLRKSFEQILNGGLAESGRHRLASLMMGILKEEPGNDLFKNEKFRKLVKRVYNEELNAKVKAPPQRPGQIEAFFANSCELALKFLNRAKLSTTK